LEKQHGLGSCWHETIFDSEDGLDVTLKYFSGRVIHSVLHSQNVAYSHRT
jgi:hypothetical protein